MKTRSPFLQFRTDAGNGPLVLADPRFFSAGNIFFVQSTNANAGDSAGHGQTPDAPYATINYAITQCTASQGDIIVVLPGHVETITAAAGVALNIAGVTIIGVGAGRLRPQINYTTAVGASLDVSAANCRIENIFFTMTGIDAITAGINVTATDFTLFNCAIETATSSAQATLALLTTAAANRLRIENCFFHGSADAGTAAALRIVGGDGHIIKNNNFVGNYTTSLGAIDNATTACTNTIVQDNTIFNRTASSTKAMVFQSGSTGQIANNNMQILSGTAPITGAAMSWVGRNYYAATIATAGTLI